MEILTEEKINLNFELFKKKLSSIVDATKLIDNYGELLKKATYSFSNKESEFCGEGFLLNTILRVLTPNALKINELLPEEKRVDVNSIIKVCLLHQISKSTMVVLNDNKWEIENRGMIYKFLPSNVALKCGMRSVAICIQCGIELTEEELEAMSNLDKEEDKQMKYYSSPLAIILKQANELTEIVNKKITL